MGRLKTMGMILFLAAGCLLLSCSGSDDNDALSYGRNDGTLNPYDIEPSDIQTFVSIDGEICREDGKPVIRLFSTTWCSHCQWIADTFDAVAQMYMDEGEIVARHWEVDTGDDVLTEQVEQAVPDSEDAVFKAFNPRESIPTFVFGCKYYRIGTGYEQENDLKAEAAEFMAVIEALINE